MSGSLTARGILAVTLAIVAVSSPARAIAVLFGDYYRFGEDDPGAVVGAVGRDPTVDSGAWKLDLTRSGLPTYSADTSPKAVGSKLSMRFSNSSSILDGPILAPALYSRDVPSIALQQAFGLETWVKTSTLTPVDPSGYAIIAACGDPFIGGFGLLQHGGDYVFRAGVAEVKLAPASTTDWTHLAYFNNGVTDGLYLNGMLQEPLSSSLAVGTAGVFMVGGSPFDAARPSLFNGLIDETRLFTYNPLSMGAGESIQFLITVPEPSALLGLLAPALFLLRRPRPS